VHRAEKLKRHYMCPKHEKRQVSHLELTFDVDIRLAQIQEHLAIDVADVEFPSPRHDYWRQQHRNSECPIGRWPTGKWPLMAFNMVDDERATCPQPLKIRVGKVGGYPHDLRWVLVPIRASQTAEVHGLLSRTCGCRANNANTFLLLYTSKLVNIYIFIH
jgi:hypothetical protein